MLPTLSILTLTNTIQIKKGGNFLKYLRIKDFMDLLLTRYYSGVQIKGDEMGGICGTWDE